MALGLSEHRRSKAIAGLIIAMALAAAPKESNAIPYKTSNRARNSAWSIGIAGYQHSLKSGDANNLLGTATAVQLGYTHISESWILLSSLDVISGPYLSPHQQKKNLDYSGTGGTISLASSAEGANIRTYAGNYGFALGVSYVDIVGRVVGERFDPDERIDQLVMRVTNFALMPSIFFTWLDEKARSESNRPSELITRIEGYYLNIGFQIPLIANYTLRYDELVDNPDSQAEDALLRTPIKEKGNLFGFSIIVSFSAFLGV